jgi:FixJ family two-component response regulator
MFPVAKQTVLLVEDDEAVRSCILTMLEDAGHDVRGYFTADTACADKSRAKLLWNSDRTW